METPRRTHRLPEAIRIRGATVISGRSRGKSIGIPTINVELSSAPRHLKHGIYACRITLGTATYGGAMHFGERPAFRDTETMEIHVLDADIKEVPATVDLEIVGFIRDVSDFPDIEKLKKAIAKDIDDCRAMLADA